MTYNPEVENLLEDFYSLNKNMEDNNTTRHLKSMALTFASTFITVLAIGMGADSFSFDRASVVALVASALLAGVRGIAKLLLEWKNVRV